MNQISKFSANQSFYFRPVGPYMKWAPQNRGSRLNSTWHKYARSLSAAESSGFSDPKPAITGLGQTADIRRRRSLVPLLHLSLPTQDYRRPSQECKDATLLLSPHLPETFESLRIILLMDPAFHSVFRQDRHHLPQGDAGKFCCSAKRCFALFVSFHRE